MNLSRRFLAHFGILPSDSLNGKFTGIYFRPRCIDPRKRDKELDKEIGLKNFLKGNSFQIVYQRH